MKKLAWIFIFFSSVCLGADDLKLLVEPENISKHIQAAATKINRQFHNEELTVIVIMKGALFISADLTRYLKSPLTIEYINTSSFDNKKMASEFNISGLEHINLKNKNLLVVDDVYDNGTTMTAVIKYLKEKKPKTIKSLVLVAMKDPTKKRYYPDYVLFNVNELGYKPIKGKEESTYIVGFGIDYQERFRELPGIYIFTEKSEK